MKAFYKKLKESIEQRLLSNENANLAYSARVLDLKQWPDNIDTHLTFGEAEIRNLSTRLQFHRYQQQKTQSGMCVKRELGQTLGFIMSHTNFCFIFTVNRVFCKKTEYILKSCLRISR